jgi:RalA-binding protein 1
MNLAPPVSLATGSRDKTVRESTISLPAEAKKYITNMVDSPARSPVLERSRSSSPEKVRSSPLVENSPQVSNISSTTTFPRVSEEKTETKSPSQPPTPRATDTPPRRPTDLKLRINGSITSGPSTVTLLNSSQASTPGEDPFEQETPYSVTSAHPFGSANMAQSSSSQQLTEIELSAISIRVKTSTIRPNDRGKEVISFIIEIEPSNKPSWRVEKLYSGILNLDSNIRSMTSRQHIKKLASLPETKLFKDNAPAKVDQRKAQLEMYLKSVVTVPVKKPSVICEFFCSDVIDESRAPVAQLGYKEGYLTKRGKNFGGWKTRYFVLQGPVLEYYENVRLSLICFPEHLVSSITSGEGLT